MRSRCWLELFLWSFLGSVWLTGQTHGAALSDRPNIILILADDLGYGDLGCYGQKLIPTPHLDRLAKEGVRFTQFYAGSTVCAPSRCVLMTGLHTGHCRVRGNAKNDLQPEDLTVAKALQQAGYATGLIGKWGLGNTPNSPGHPNRQGFDYFFGYLNQGHAHNHFPDHLWRNGQRVALPNEGILVGNQGAGYATNRVQYAGDLFAEEGLSFIERHRGKPFFLYYAPVVPHANNERKQALGDGQEVPDYGPFATKPWPAPNKGYASMIHRLDADVGRLIGRLKELGLDRNTVVIFTSDNGPQKEGGQDMSLFDSNGPLRGIKRDLTDGGIRVPFIAWWPGHIKGGRVSGQAAYFGDVFATAADFARIPIPAHLGSLSLMPVLLGKPGQKSHDYLYWEFHEGGSSQAVLLEGRWKGLRLKRQDAPIQLYDLKRDLGEEHDLASIKPALVERVKSTFTAARQASPDWPLLNAPTINLSPSP